MGFFRYRQRTDGSPQPDLPAGTERRGGKGYERIPDSDPEREKITGCFS